MTMITEKNTTPHSCLIMTTEASELGLKPGEWPNRIGSDMGNKRDFCKDGLTTAGSHVYVQELGCLTLHIYND
jgi:hypothetical protein